MSKLQEFMGKIVQIIVSYNETQTTINHSEDFSSKSPGELHQFLQDIITEATTVYETRKSLLEYFLFIVDTIKPLTDKKQSLSQIEQQTIFDTLSSLMNTIKLLLKTSHSNSITVKYSNSIEKMPGFMRGALKGYSLCNTGQVISRELAESLNQVPFGDYLKKLIFEHQLPLLEIERMGKAISDGSTEKELMQEKIKTLTEQIEQQQQEVANLKMENQELSSKFELFKADTELKEKQPRPEIEENILLRQQLEELKTKLLVAEEKSILDTEEIRHLKKEVNLLQDLQSTPSINFYDNLHYHGLFTLQPVPDNRVANTTNNHASRTQKTGYSPKGNTQIE